MYTFTVHGVLPGTIALLKAHLVGERGGTVSEGERYNEKTKQLVAVDKPAAGEVFSAEGHGVFLNCQYDGHSALGVAVIHRPIFISRAVVRNTLQDAINALQPNSPTHPG